MHGVLVGRVSITRGCLLIVGRCLFIDQRLMGLMDALEDGAALSLWVCIGVGFGVSCVGYWVVGLVCIEVLLFFEVFGFWQCVAEAGPTGL